MAVCKLEKKIDIGITASKETDFSEWYIQTVQKAQLADYAPVKGLIVLRPDGYAIWESLQYTFNKRFAEEGVRNGFLPILIPESLLGREKEHFAGFNPEVFWVTHSGDNELGDRLALRPTSETIAYTMYAKWIRSWRDLPLKINFWNTALRSEIKATKPFLRTSEFLWQEGHTVHATSNEAEEQVYTMLEIYKNVVEQELAIPVISGTKSEREKFVGAGYTTAIEAIMPDGKALQMGTSHFLAQNFSKPFDVKFADKDNVEHFAWQTSWGVSWRLIGAMIMVHGDDKGVVMPPRVAPIQIVIVPIYRNDEQKNTVMKMACDVEKTLTASCRCRTHTDDRDDVTPGFKFNDWEMKGVPLRIEIGPRDVQSKSVVVVQRYDGQKIQVGADDLADKIPRMLDDIQGKMLQRARNDADKNTYDISEYDEFKDRYNKADSKTGNRGGFVRAPWCGRAECEERIKDDTGAEIRVIPFGADQKRQIIKNGNEDVGTDSNRTADDMHHSGPNASSSDEEYAQSGSGDSSGSDSKCIVCRDQGLSTPVFAKGY